MSNSRVAEGELGVETDGDQKSIEGEIFRHSYLRSPLPVSDSIRARRRIAQAIWDDNLFNSAKRDELVSNAKGEIGVAYPYYHGYDHTKFCENSEIEDILSIITIAFRASLKPQAFLARARRIFHEEHRIRPV